MAILIDIIIPVFGLAALGYVLVRGNVFDDRVVDGLSSFVFTLALPVMLFQTMAENRLPETIEWAFVLAYYVATFLVFVAATRIARRGYGRGLDGQAMIALAASYSNAILLGLPLILAAFGEVAALPYFLLIAFHSSLLFTVTTVLAEAGRSRGTRWQSVAGSIVRGVATNPIIIGLTAGVAFNLLDLTIPGMVRAVTDKLAQTALPCAVFAMGASLARCRIVGSLGEAGLVMGLKLVIHPLLVWVLAVHVFAVSDLWAAVAVVLAAMPTGINAYLFAERYRTATATVATTVVASTLLSIGTLSVLLAWLEVR